MRNIEQILKNMSIKEKANALTQVNANVVCASSKAEITGLDANLTLDTHDLASIGSILNVDNVRESNKIQRKHLKEDPNKIPLLFMLDVVHGYETIYPIPLGMGASFDKELCYECAKMAAKEARISGIHVTFAPMVDVARDARWGRVMESFGEDPFLISELAKETVKGFQEDIENTGIASCPKHFAAYGAVEAGRDYNTVDMSLYRLRNVYLKPFKACVDAGTKTMMSAFVSMNGTPAVGSSLFKKILRDEWNFDGLLITDYSAVKEQIIHGTAKNDKECAFLSFNASNDIEMMSSTYSNYLNELVDEKRIKEEDINKSVLRLLKLKQDLNVFEKPYFNESIKIDYEKNRELVREAATKACVLLKNDNILPLADDNKKVLVIGPLAEKGMLGNWHSNGNRLKSISLLDGLKNNTKFIVSYKKGYDISVNSKDYSMINEAVSEANKFDYVILTLGEDELMSGESFSRADLNLSKAQIKLIEELHNTGVKIISIIYSGRPLVLSDIVDYSDAIVEVWMPGTEGGNAIADLLVGKTNFSAKLPISFPRTTGQCPIYYSHLNTGKPKPYEEYNFGYKTMYIDCSNEPLYPFGYGLSYSMFRISSPVINKTVITGNEKLVVEVDVYNISNRKGTEIVQLYIHDLVSSYARPVKELIGFKNIEIDRNSKTTARFEIDRNSLGFYDENGKYMVEDGTFELFVGNSSTTLNSILFEYKNE